MSTPNKPVKKNEARSLFAPFFRARWQNMQNILNDSVFYTMLPPKYKSYYNAYIRQWLEYASGFVPSLHSGDFFAIGMGYTVIDIFVRECMAGGFRLEGKAADKAQIEAWAEDYDLDGVYSQMFFYSNAGGNAILALTPLAGSGACYPSVYPINRIFFSVNKRNRITRARMLNRFMADCKDDKEYYAVEDRFLVAGLPYYRVRVYESAGTATSVSWNDSLGVERLPWAAKAAFSEAYGNIECNTWYELPFQSIGLYNVKNKAVAVALSDLPGYADSTLHTALDILYGIDYNYTGGQMDQYMAKSRALVPEEMRTRNVNANPLVRVAGGSDFATAVESAPLNDEIYSAYPNHAGASEGGKAAQPVFIQPDLRGEVRKFIRDGDFELLASKVGLSSSTLANHLTFNTSKTATEVRTEEGTTETSVKIKHKLARAPINAMYKDLCKFLGCEPVTHEWGMSGVNSAEQNRQLLDDYNAGTIPLDEYLKKRWPQMSEDEIQKWILKIQAQQNVSDIFDPNTSLLNMR